MIPEQIIDGASSVPQNSTAEASQTSVVTAKPKGKAKPKAVKSVKASTEETSLTSTVTTKPKGKAKPKPKAVKASDASIEETSTTPIVSTKPKGKAKAKTKDANDSEAQAAETSNNPKGKGFRAINYADPSHYIQVGCEIYLLSWKPDARGHLLPDMQPWKYSQLKRDFAECPGRIDFIPRFNGLCCLPSHLDYQAEVNGYYNTYCRLPWPHIEGEWPTIKNMYIHIFGSQYELGLDYMQLLYTKPTQMLPILVLVSKTRQTGKTTFLNFLKEIFGPNMSFVTNETLRSGFNGERASSLIQACDEAIQNKKEDTERLKALSTAQKTYIEHKGKDRYEIDNYCKIILCSNNVNDPVYIDVEEVRFWVIEVPQLQHDNPGVLEAMKREIPAFLYYLLHRKMSVPEPCSRMWFKPEHLRTPALERIKRMCRPTPELELAETLLDEMDVWQVDKLEYTSQDLATLLKARNRDVRDAHRIVCKQWNIPHASNKHAYKLYAPWCDRGATMYGRYYTFTRAFLQSHVPDDTMAKASPVESQSSLF